MRRQTCGAPDGCEEETQRGDAASELHNEEVKVESGINTSQVHVLTQSQFLPLMCFLKSHHF